MSPAEIIEQATVEGVTLALSPAGIITATGDQSVVDKWLPTIRENKPSILCELQRERRRAKVQAMLEAAPGTQRAIYPDTDSEPHNVILAVAVRACMQTCELLIPKAKYDPWRLLKLIERHGQTTH